MTWWRQLDDTHKLLTIIIAVIAAAFMAGATLVTYTAIPDRVEKVEEKVADLDISVIELRYSQSQILRGIERANCNLDNIMQDTNKLCP